MSKTLKIAVIGAGPSGIAAGHELLKQGFSDFTIFDALDAPGGTWRSHSYPGLACDVWAHSYTFSYAPNPDWSASFVDQPEIQAYLARSASEFGLDPHLRLNTRILSAHWQTSGCWRLTAEGGESFEFDIVINAMGNQHTPALPDVPGMDSFQGDSWHSTNWNHTVDLTGKRVVVVGSAAAAVQVVPKVAEQAGHLTVLQRTANWIMPRNRKIYSERQRRWFHRLPILMKMLRGFQGMLMGQVQYAVTHGHKRMEQFEGMAKKYIDASFSDPAMRKVLTPDSRYGCKRGLVSDDFYPALNRDNVELVASGLREVTPSGIVTSDGRSIDVDVIIYCTGYRILDLDRIDVVGSEGSSLAQVMQDSPRAFKGISVPGFPNYFFAVGPNGLVLNVSYFRSTEKNLETVVRLLQEMQAAAASKLEVKREEFDRYNAWLDSRFDKFSWGSADCNSYYRAASGHAPFLFAGSFKEWCELHAAAGLQEYQVD